ncbi:MAG: (2Fe-2S)-binding protein [Candidatus Izemoplasmatales bacterium]|nr:(2Fe-2S)-binding protein [Candidatus Izemoplasmatales bacterium]
MRIFKHPILDFPKKKVIHFQFDGVEFSGVEGDTIASALYANGIKKLSESVERHRARGLYCAIGNCSSCYMTVDHIPNIKTCVTPLSEGMIVESQIGKGVIR